MSQSGVLRPGRVRGEVVETRREQAEMAGVNLRFQVSETGDTRDEGES